MMEYVVPAAIGIVGVAVLLSAMRMIRPTERGLIERFGKYNRFANPGLNFIIPFAETVKYVNITEQIVEVAKQEIITSDNLNAVVDAQIYYKIQEDESSIKKSQYAVNDFEYQIVALARTTMRNIIGTMSLKEANSERNRLNIELKNALEPQIESWGINIVRSELREISPPADVQETMNKVVKASNEKVAAIDFATATETQADGARRAMIKKAEGEKQFNILTAEGRAEAVVVEAKAKAGAIKMVSEAQVQYFKGGAQRYMELETTQAALKDNTKYVLGKEDVTMIFSDDGKTKVIPMKDKTENERKS